MNEEHRKEFDWHRRVSEIGGLLLGGGAGMVLAAKIGNGVVVTVLGLVMGVAGYIVLLNEQRKWNKRKKKE